ncbi:hypothetical protein Tco_1225949 [Tanacetum coccineum]
MIEQPIPPALVFGPLDNELEDWNALYDVYNNVACLMLISMSTKLQREFENYSPYDMLQELKSIYVELLERLGYVLRQVISVGLILNSLINDFARFVRDYNMHNMGKTISELHDLLIEISFHFLVGHKSGNFLRYEKGLPKKAATPQVLAIQEHTVKDSTCYHCKEVALEKELSCLFCWVDEEKEARWFFQYLRYPKETMNYYFYFPPENKIVVARYVEFFENNLISQEASGRVVELEKNQDEDISPYENTSKHLVEAESIEPQEDVAPIRRSVRTHQALEHLCLNVEFEEHSLGDLNEPTNYKAASSDPESTKWLDAMNAEMQ